MKKSVEPICKYALREILRVRKEIDNMNKGKQHLINMEN